MKLSDRSVYGLWYSGNRQGSWASCLISMIAINHHTKNEKTNVTEIASSKDLKI